MALRRYCSSQISADEAIHAEAIRRGSALAEATNFARDLVNEPPNVLTPTELANRASTMAQQYGLECEILDRPQMQELGMGGLLGVAQGSAEPPKFIILRYRGATNSADKGMALVGKGITFDTGGISIKPASDMDEMKGDMAGAAAVIGAMQAIAALKPAINVTALVSINRKYAQWHRLSPWRYSAHYERQNHRNRQYRCRGSSRAGRRSFICSERRAFAHHRRCHLDRRHRRRPGFIP